MIFRVILFLPLLLFGGSGTIFSQETAIVSILPSKPVVIGKGQTTRLTVTAKIKKGFHIQANPAAEEFLIPTTLTIQASKGVIPGKPVYPPGKPYKLNGSTEELLTYEDKVIISLPVKVDDSALAGNTELTGKFNFQPCDDRKCLFPRSVPVIFPLKIVYQKK